MFHSRVKIWKLWSKTSIFIFTFTSGLFLEFRHECDTEHVCYLRKHFIFVKNTLKMHVSIYNIFARSILEFILDQRHSYHYAVPCRNFRVNFAEIGGWIFCLEHKGLCVWNGAHNGRWIPRNYNTGTERQRLRRSRRRRVEESMRQWERTGGGEGRGRRRERGRTRRLALIRDNCSRSRDDKGGPSTFPMQARVFSRADKGPRHPFARPPLSRSAPTEENYASSFSLARKITGNRRNYGTGEAHPSRICICATYTCMYTRVRASSASWNLLCNYPPVTLAVAPAGVTSAGKFSGCV